jgi:hypothetical protein
MAEGLFSNDGPNVVAIAGTATGAGSIGVCASGDGAGLFGISDKGWAVNGENNSGVGVRGISKAGLDREA